MDFLEKPTVVFVRLKEPVVLDSALEAPVPVRFFFVLVGPGKSDVDYHETGRAMAALMADKVSELTLFQSINSDVLKENTAVLIFEEVEPENLGTWKSKQ